MATHTALTPTDVAALCSRFSLGALQSYRSIAAGTINSNFYVASSEGEFFLRVNEGKGEDDVALEAAILHHLASADTPVLLPRVSTDGLPFAQYQGHYLSCFPWSSGHHSDKRSPPECAEIGRALAQLHLAGRSFRIQATGRYATAEVEREYHRFASSNDAHLRDALALLADEFDVLRARASERGALPSGLIHADLFPDNVLMQGGQVLALLDFEQACFGSYVYDLAVCCNAWCFGAALDLERLRAMVAGYTAVRALSEEESAGLQTELRASAVRFLVTRIRDIYLPAKRQGQAEPKGKDFRRFLMRLQTWRSEDVLSLADLSSRPVGL